MCTGVLCARIQRPEVDAGHPTLLFETAFSHATWSVLLVGWPETVPFLTSDPQ